MLFCRSGFCWPISARYQTLCAPSAWTSVLDGSRADLLWPRRPRPVVKVVVGLPPSFRTTCRPHLFVASAPCASQRVLVTSDLWAHIRPRTTTPWIGPAQSEGPSWPPLPPSALPVHVALPSSHCPPVLQVSTSRNPLVSGALSVELATVPRGLPRLSRALAKASSKSEARSYLPSFAHEACHPLHSSCRQAVPDIIPPPVPDTAAGAEAVGTFCLVLSVADLDDDRPIPLLGWNRDVPPFPPLQCRELCPARVAAHESLGW